VPLPPPVGRAIDTATAGRAGGPILRNTRGTRMDRHAATRRLHHLAQAAGVRLPRMHPHTYVTTMLDAGVDLRDVQIVARHADPRTTMRYDRARQQLDRHPSFAPAMSTGRVMFSRAVSVGTRLYAWKTNPSRSRHSLVSPLSFRPLISTPSMTTRPEVGESSAAMQCISVDFPSPKDP
jgi:hypothetical protein